MSDVSGGSGGSKWVGARCGGGGVIGGSLGVERGGSDAASTYNECESDRKAAKSCGDNNSEQVGHGGNGKGVSREGDWLLLGEGGDDDMARMGDGGKNDGGSDASYGCDDRQTGEDIGMGTAGNSERGGNVS